MSKAKDFYWSEEREPHFLRRKEMIKKYPEIRELYGLDKNLKFITLGLVALQLVIAPFVYEMHWAIFLLISYFVGASASHTILLAIHEITHNMAFKSRTANNWLALVANIPIVVPFSMSFQTYHAKHHWEQGSEKHDTDLPTKAEAAIFKGAIGKSIWASIQILFYALRPMIVYPIKWEKWHYINFIFQIIVISIYAYFVGYGAIIYLLVSMLFAGSIHPLAAHFIAEHYVFVEGQETYSYYGPLNKLALNVGYHNEHHDFPNIPGSRLPDLYKMAPEFYENLYVHSSWVNVIYQFITNKKIGLYSRVKRDF